MGFRASEEKQVVIDLDKINNMKACDQVGPEGNSLSIRPQKATLTRNWSGFDRKATSDGSHCIKRSSSSSNFGHREDKSDFAEKRMVGDGNVVWDKLIEPERQRKKVIEKHSKPPRPPKSLSVTAADQVLIREISKLSMLKRARAERMKEAKRKKKTKANSSYINSCAMIVTIIFCLIIIWHAF